MVSKSFKQIKTVPISLICTTYKRPGILSKLVVSLNKNTLLPNEVIIVGTSENDFKIINKNKYKFKIKKLISKDKNQILQRNLGIKFSKNALIIQCDDDIRFDKNFIRNFYKHFKFNQNQKKIVGALIINSENKNQSYRWNRTYKEYLLFRLIILLLNNFKKIKFMSLLASGRIAPLLPDKFINKKKYLFIENLEWLSSTLCYNKNIVKRKKFKDFKYNKKSYFEDVFFTHLNFKNGFNLILDSRIVAKHDTIEPTDLITHLKSIPVQLELVNFFKKSKLLFFLDSIIFSLIYLLKSLFFIFKK